MRYVILFIFLSVSNITFAQSDTDIIRKAIDYMNSEKFLKVLKDSLTVQIEKYSSTAKTKKKIRTLKEGEWRDVAFLLNEGNCYYTDRYYRRTNALSRFERGNLDRKDVKMDTVLLQTKYAKTDSTKCNKSYELDATICDESYIELEYFHGGRGSGIRFGTGYVFSFKINKEEVSFISLNQIFYN